MKIMLTIELNPDEASLADVKHKLSLDAGEIDESFGVVCVSPEQNLYTILVEEEAAKKAAGNEGVRGPYSDPRIEPFGPPS